MSAKRGEKRKAEVDLSSKSIKRKAPNELTVDKKKQVLDMVDKGMSYRKVSENFSIANATVTNIVRNRTSIVKLWEDNCSHDRKRKMRQTENDEVNEKVLEFFTKCRAAEFIVLQCNQNVITDDESEEEIEQKEEDVVPEVPICEIGKGTFSYQRT